jgi:hypothetical protein
MISQTIDIKYSRLWKTLEKERGKGKGMKETGDVH